MRELDQRDNFLSRIVISKIKHPDESLSLLHFYLENGKPEVSNFIEIAEKAYKIAETMLQEEMQKRFRQYLTKIKYNYPLMYKIESQEFIKKWGTHPFEKSNEAVIKYLNGVDDEQGICRIRNVGRDSESSESYGEGANRNYGSY